MQGTRPITATVIKTQADVEKATHAHGQKVRDILTTCFCTAGITRHVDERRITVGPAL